MFTQTDSESDLLVESQGKGSKEETAKEIHAEIEAQSRKVMVTWILLLSINFMTHFMRMSVVMLYCIKRFDASEFSVGLLASVHMLIMSVANAYLCYSVDSYSFESMMTVRFSLLTLATLGEYLADSFLSFSLIYCAASLSVVWFGLQSAFLMKLLPPVHAKKLISIGLLLNQFGIIIGLSLGGCVGGLISLRGVFLLSFAVAAFSLAWIVFVLNGSEKRIKERQLNEIAPIYQDMPHLFTNTNEMFPMPFISDHMEEEEQSEIGSISREDRPILLAAEKKDHQSKSESSNSNSSMMMADEQQQHVPDLFSYEAIPFWVLTFRSSLKTGTMTEFVAWWNVYAHQVYGANISQSSGQYVVGIVVSIIVSGVCIAKIKHQTLDFDVLLKWNTILCVSTGSVTAILFIWIFPHLRFIDFWWALSLLNVLFGVILGFPNTLQVFESPVEKAGKMYAANIAMLSSVPAIQHVIIGALWENGGHLWMMRWFGMMHALSFVVVFVYYLLRRNNPPKRGIRMSRLDIQFEE